MEKCGFIDKTWIQRCCSICMGWKSIWGGWGDFLKLILDEHTEIDLGISSREGAFPFANRCFLCGKDEENI